MLRETSNGTRGRLGNRKNIWTRRECQDKRGKEGDSPRGHAAPRAARQSPKSNFSTLGRGKHDSYVGVWAASPRCGRRSRPRVCGDAAVALRRSRQSMVSCISYCQSFLPLSEAAPALSAGRDKPAHPRQREVLGKARRNCISKHKVKEHMYFH